MASSGGVGILGTRGGNFRTQGLGEQYNLNQLPPDLAIQEQEVTRRQQIADAILQQALEGSGVPAYSSSGRFVVPMGWGAGVGQLAKAALGAWAIGKNAETKKAIGEESKQRVAQAMAEFQKGSAPAPAMPERFVGNQEAPGGEAMAAQPASSERTQSAINNILAGQAGTHPVVQALMAHHQANLERTMNREDIQAEQARARAEAATLKREMGAAQLKSEEERARQHNETMQALQGTKPVVVPPGGTVLKSGEAPYTAPIKPETAPTGYRHTKNGNLELIPGGPADEKIQGKFAADTAAFNGANQSLDRLQKTVMSLRNHPGLIGITGLRGHVPNIPGTAAADAEAKLNQLKSETSIDVLQMMRANSKTGGALGNVSDAEGKRLENYLGALDKAQSTESMQKALDDIIAYVDESKANLGAAFNMKHKTTAVGASSGSKAALPQSAKVASDTANVQALQERRKNTIKFSELPQ